METLTKSLDESKNESPNNEELSPLDIAEEFFRCKYDIKYFAQKYVFINDPQALVQSTFQFEPWPFQLDLFDAFDENDLTIILKGRQLGVSWVVCIYALHKILFWNNANVLMLSKREDEAQKLILKVKFVYNNLPSWMRLERPIAGRDGGNKKELVIEKKKKDEAGLDVTVHRGSVLALPATKDAGRSETASIVIADEWAFHKYAADNWTALSPTIDSGGKFIGVSTANGLGNFYYKQWKSAERDINGFKPIFLAYDLRPGRDEEWYEQKKRSYQDEKMFHQEYPRSPLEAFITTGGCIFDLGGLQYLADNVCREPLTKGQITNGPLLDLIKQWPEIKVWDTPKVGAAYVIGADPAGGDAGSDFSCAYVLNANTREVVATVHGRIEPDNFAGILASVGDLYNDALLVVERNNHGYAVHNALKNQYNYGNIFHFKKDRQIEGDNKEGMPTNSKTKPIMETYLQGAIRDRKLEIYDLEFVFEAQSYVRKAGRTGAESDDQFDDRVLALMFALMGIEVGAAKRARRMGPRRPAVVQGHFRTRHR